MDEEYKKHIDMLPAHMWKPMLAYIERGIPVGDFLTAVLSNNLIRSWQYAYISRLALHRYCEYLYNYAPNGCYGSRTKVADWLASGGLKGAKS